MPGLATNPFRHPDGYSTPSVHFDSLLAMALNEYLLKNPAVEFELVGRQSAIVCFRNAFPDWAHNIVPGGKWIFMQDS